MIDRRAVAAFVLSCALALPAAAQITLNSNDNFAGLATFNGNKQLIFHRGVNLLDGVANSAFFVDTNSAVGKTSDLAAGAPYSSSVLAGLVGTTGTAANTETEPLTARFNQPSGIAPVPHFAAMGRTRSAAHADAVWEGILVADTLNYAIEFINFRRQGKVTIVAGGGSQGVVDGLGGSATLGGPRAMSAGTIQLDVPTWLVLFADNNNCVRQGALTSTTTSGEVTMQNMLLDITSFVGVCSSGSPQSTQGVGAEFTTITGVRLADPFSQHAATVLFVAEDTRLTIVTPLYPAGSRSVANVVTGSYLGIPLPYVRPGGTASSAELELFVTSSTVSHTVSQIVVTLTKDLSGAVTAQGTSSDWVIAGSNVQDLIFVPTASGALAIFSTDGEFTFHYYCCFNGLYGLDPQRLTSTATMTAELPTPAPATPPPATPTPGTPTPGTPTPDTPAPATPTPGTPTPATPTPGTPTPATPTPATPTPAPGTGNATAFCAADYCTAHGTITYYTAISTCVCTVCDAGWWGPWCGTAGSAPVADGTKHVAVTSSDSVASADLVTAFSTQLNIAASTILVVNVTDGNVTGHNGTVRVTLLVFPNATVAARADGLTIGELGVANVFLTMLVAAPSTIAADAGANATTVTTTAVSNATVSLVVVASTTIPRSHSSSPVMTTGAAAFAFATFAMFV